MDTQWVDESRDTCELTEVSFLKVCVALRAISNRGGHRGKHTSLILKPIEMVQLTCIPQALVLLKFILFSDSSFIGYSGLTHHVFIP